MGGVTGSEDYLQSVGSYVAAALDPLGIDVKIDIETPEGRKSCHVTRQTSSATSTTTQEASAEEKVEESDKKEEEPKKPDQVVEPEPAKKAATPSDDEEDWTVVSDKKDTEEEAVKDPEEVTKDQGSLYPDLLEAKNGDIGKVLDIL